ncbi:hypothetical protein [Sorangium sp. So ce1024]|uniref:hypothetical protein n=1 Tax=Sorangium sp. So ce1024 TaxID=3133327 RepID=UPI003F022E30
MSAQGLIRIDPREQSPLEGGVARAGADRLDWPAMPSSRPAGGPPGSRTRRRDL